MAVGASAGIRSHIGSVFNIDASVSLSVSPSNGRRAVSISKRTTPKAQMSARLSTAAPRACSGLMYAAVPRISPACGGVDRQGRRVHGGDARPGSGRERFRESEVEHLDRAVRADLDVRGLEIAMDDAAARARLRAPRRSAARSAELRRSGSHRARFAATESSPSTSSITSAVDAVGFFDTVDRGDVRVIRVTRAPALRG